MHQCPAMLSSKRCALHCAFSSFPWDKTEVGASQATHEPINTKISLLWCAATLLLQDYDQDVSATQKTVTHQFNHLFHSHNHIICVWVWLLPEKQLLTLGLPSGKSSAYATLMSELLQPSCVLSLEGQNHAWPREMHTQRLQQALSLLTMNTALHHYSTDLPGAMSQSSPHWQSYAFPSMKDYLQILL